MAGDRNQEVADGCKCVYAYNQKAQPQLKAQDCPPQAWTPNSLPIPPLGSGHAAELLSLGTPLRHQAWDPSRPSEFVLFCFCSAFLFFVFGQKQTKVQLPLQSGKPVPSAVLSPGVSQAWPRDTAHTYFLTNNQPTLGPPPTSYINKHVIEPRTHLQREDQSGLGSRRTRQEAAHSQA